MHAGLDTQAIESVDIMHAFRRYGSGSCLNLVVEQVHCAALQGAVPHQPLLEDNNM